MGSTVSTGASNLFNSGAQIDHYGEFKLQEGCPHMKGLIIQVEITRTPLSNKATVMALGGV